MYLCLRLQNTHHICVVLTSIFFFTKSSRQISVRVTIRRETKIGFKSPPSGVTMDANSSQNPTQSNPKQSVNITRVNFDMATSSPVVAHIYY